MIWSVYYLTDTEKKKLVPFITEMFRVWCWEEFGFYLYGFQLEFASQFFLSALVTRNDICLKVARQSGKTETITLLLRFLMRFWIKLFSTHFRVAISSPKGEQAKTDIDRIKMSILQLVQRWHIEDRENNANTIRAYHRGQLISEMYKFSLMPTTSNESKTLDVSVVEEAHKIDDKKRSDEIDPMLTSTNGFTVFIGVGATQSCDFQAGAAGERQDTVAIIADCNRVIKERREAYKATGDPTHLNYEKKVQSEMKKKGKRNPEFRRNYLLEDMIEIGDYISLASLQRLRRKPKAEVSIETLFLGGDFGKKQDQSVFTIMNENFDIVDWIVFERMNYTDQFDLLEKELEKRGYLEDIISVRGDSTGAGDVAFEIWRNVTQLPIGEESQIIFSVRSKDIMYTTLDELLFSDDPKRRLSYPANHEYTDQFEYQMTNLQREYKGDGEYLVPHHKDEEGEHDDYCDSTALCTLAVSGILIGDIIGADDSSDSE